MEDESESSAASSVEEEESEEETEQTALRQQLKDHTFEELEALKQKMGLKEFNEAMFGKKKGDKGAVRVKKRKDLMKGKGGKGRPMEVSSKRRVPKLRQVVDVPRNQKRDPRFDKSSGEFKDEYWNTNYGFLRDLQKKEVEDLKTKVKTEVDSTKQKEMKRFIQRANDKEKAIVAKEREAQRQKEIKEENKKRIAEGKRPFYMKESTKKLVELAEKYDELKASGGLDKYLKKKRKRNAVRDRKSLK